ncbi:MAG: ATP-binding protein [Actinomycetota bacterium]
MSVAVPAAAERFALELPADPAYLATARLFASTLARQLEVDEERIEDLKLAISEACAAGIRSGAGPVELSAIHRDWRLSFEVNVRGSRKEPAPSPAEDMGATLGTGLIEALFEGAEVLDLPDGGQLIRFVVEVT